MAPWEHGAFRMAKSFDDSLRMERFKMRIVGPKETSP